MERWHRISTVNGFRMNICETGFRIYKKLVWMTALRVEGTEITKALA